MGFPPPPAGPPPAAQQAAAVSAGFSAGPPVVSLCGFTLPSFVFSIKFNLPSIFPLPLPSFHFSIGLNCSLTNPLDISGGVSFGGGRVPTYDPDPDMQLAEAA